MKTTINNINKQIVVVYKKASVMSFDITDALFIFKFF